MTPEQIKQMLAAQEAQYKAMGLDKDTIKLMMQQVEASIKMMYGGTQKILILQIHLVILSLICRI